MALIAQLGKVTMQEDVFTTKTRLHYRDESPPTNESFPPEADTSTEPVSETSTEVTTTSTTETLSPQTPGSTSRFNQTTEKVHPVD